MQKIIFNVIDIIEINILKNVKKITQCPSAEDRYIKRLDYSINFSLACLLWNGGVPGTSSVIRFFGDVFAWISLLAGAFDGLENLALIQLLLRSELTVWNGMSR